MNLETCFGLWEEGPGRTRTPKQARWCLIHVETPGDRRLWWTSDSCQRQQKDIVTIFLNGITLILLNSQTVFYATWRESVMDFSHPGFITDSGVLNPKLKGIKSSFYGCRSRKSRVEHTNHLNGRLFYSLFFTASATLFMSVELELSFYQSVDEKVKKSLAPPVTVPPLTAIYSDFPFSVMYIFYMHQNVYCLNKRNDISQLLAFLTV